jgi:hypothetical protein
MSICRYVDMYSNILNKLHKEFCRQFKDCKNVENEIQVYISLLL